MARRIPQSEPAQLDSEQPESGQRGSERAPGLAEVIDATLEQKLPLRISWGKLHRRAVAATVAECVVLVHETRPHPPREGLMPAPDIVKMIDEVLRRKLPRRVRWTDELESNIVAYAVAEQIVRFFDLEPRAEPKTDRLDTRPAKRRQSSTD